MNTKTWLYLFLLFISFAACTSDNTNKEMLVNAGDSLALMQKNALPENTRKFDMVISDIPFPFEILDDLYSKKVPFDEKAMNSIGNMPKYNQYNSKALNLGIYGADLAYSVTYEQFQQMGVYVKQTKQLAEDLNIPVAFDQAMMDKYTKFKDNKDSLTRIVYESYNKVDQSLKNDERVGMAALVVTGSWLEGLYLSTKTFINVPKTNENTSLYKTIAGQKQSLVIVIRLLEEYKDDAFIAGMINDLKTITSEYKPISNSKMMNEQQLISIHAKVEALRKKIIEGQ